MFRDRIRCDYTAGMGRTGRSLEETSLGDR